MILNHLSQAGNFTEKDKNALIAAIHEQNKSKYDKVDRIAEYQEYVNTELDSCCCLLTSLYTPVVGQYLPFYKASGSMEVQDGLVTLKPGQRVQINVSLGYRGTSSDTKFANVAYSIRDYTNNKDIRYYQPLAGSYQYEIPYTTHIQYTNNTDMDCQIGVYVSKVYTNKDLDPLYCNFTVMEIGRAITIDPVEYVNTSQGIEDAPVGHIISHMGTVAPKHYLVCDGAEYPIADYPYLVQHIKDNFGSVNYFGGDGTITFAVPDLRERFLKGSDSAGENEEAGLPNITGTFSVMGNGGSTGNMNVDTASGAFYRIARNGWKDVFSTSMNANQTYYAGFDASKSNAMYGKSSTVTPTNTSVLYCIKYEPTYYMQVHQTNYMQLNQYSEEEQVIGKWIDGKPIYRVCMCGTTPSATGVQEFHSAPWRNFESLVRLDGYVSGSNADGNIRHSIQRNDLYQVFPYTTGNLVWYVHPTATNYTSRPYFAVVEYTKTTDEPNSFTDSMLKESYIDLAFCTEEELQNAIQDIVAEINKEPEVIPEDTPTVIPELYPEEDEPTVIPELYPEEDEPTVIPEGEPESTEPTEPEGGTEE